MHRMRLDGQACACASIIVGKNGLAFFIFILCLSQATTNASSTSEAKPWEANDLRRSTARLSFNGPRFGVSFGTTDETTYALGSRRV